MSAATLAGGLLRTSLESALLILLIALLVRALPSMPARLRCALWWAAGLKLVAGLALALAWPSPLEVAVLPATVSNLSTILSPANPEKLPSATPGPVAAPTIGSLESVPGPAPGGREPFVSENTAAAGMGAESHRSAPSWSDLATLGAALWLCGVLALAGAAFLRRRRVGALLGRAEPIDEPATLNLLTSLAGRFGVAPPQLLVSAEISTPQVTGALRPRLLLPADHPSGAELEMILAHELAHLRRRDLWWGWVPALARGLFFFHPLVPLAVREYVLAREAACDAEVLRVVHATPRAYGRLLLRWGALGLRADPVAATLGHPRQLKRRLLMLHTTSSTPVPPHRLRRFLPLIAALPILLALLPVRLVAAPGPLSAAGEVEASATQATSMASTPASAPHAPASAPTPPTPNDSVAVATSPAAPTSADSPASPPVLATATSTSPAAFSFATAPTAGTTYRVSAAADNTGTPGATYRVASAAPGSAATPGMATSVSAHDDSDSDTHTSYAYSWDENDSEPMIYLKGRNHSVGFSTSSGQWDRVHELQRGGEPLLWFIRDSQEYVIRDAALLAEVERAYGPVMELGKEQGELGARQGELGAEQGKLGGQQGGLGGNQGELGARQAQLSVELSRLHLERTSRQLENKETSKAERARIERQERELRDKIRALGDEQRALGERQRELGEGQRELGERQRALGEEQRRLGERQREASDAARSVVDGVLDRAIANGKAEKVR